MSRPRLTVVALSSLLATALLGFAVSRGFAAFRVERHVIHLLGHPPNVERWTDLADFLAVPVIATVVVVSVVYGAVRRVFLRVAALAGFAAVALVISEQIIKPAVQQRLHGELSFPSGNVTAVCATALAMWLALYPVLGKSLRGITFGLGAAWTALMSLAVVGAFWHTPLDCIGSVLVSIGIVTAGAAIVAPGATRGPPVPAADREPVMGRA
jgi:hypothetical protein